MRVLDRLQRLHGFLGRLRNRQHAQKQFRREFEAFAALGSPRFSMRWKERLPCLTDRTTGTEFDRHYVYHPAWAVRVLARTRPAEHTDISSHLSFCAIVSAFLPVKFYDYRPAALELSSLSSGAADLLALPFESGSISSLSCMHTIEHIGLGRYGEPVDPDADLKAVAELKRVLAPGGALLFATPVGAPRLQFNAHRIYSYAQIMSYFAPLKLREFALIQDDAKSGGLIYGAPALLADEQTYGCGCFWFEKPPLQEQNS